MIMNLKVIKRDGRKVKFDKIKIYDAIIKAFEEVDKEISSEAKRRATTISNHIESLDKNFTVEKIQDIVEAQLMSGCRKDVARAYILYRAERTRHRDRNTKLMKDIHSKLIASDVKNQNANVDERSFGGRIGEASDTVLKQYALDNCMSEMSKNNHLNNEVYIHDLNSYAVGMHNCFQRNTSFITNYGIKTFEDFKDGDNIKVRDKNGEWKDATVRMYGRQKMNNVTLERCGIKKIVNCTANHRWILKDGIVTTELKVGDRLIGLSDNATRYKPNSYRDMEMFSFGFVIGDGCDHENRIQARLCSKKMQYESYFINSKYRKHNVKNSEDVIYSKKSQISKQSFLDNSMWNILSLEDKISLFNGYMSADGSTTTETNFVWTSDERIVQMITDIAPLCGYYIFKISKKEDSTNYKENRILYQITFSTKYSNNSTWIVKDISPQPNKDYEAWCVEEPTTMSFTLSNGIITGNCLTIPFDKLLANGFNTRQTDVRPANSINTAFQLVAVLFQLQSLMQFGGVSASHIDWTMIPYVRKSFRKHFIDGTKYVERVDTELEEWLSNNNELSFNHIGLKENYPKTYEYAMDMTIRETYQAVEGMYHNLNFGHNSSNIIMNFA